MFSKNIKVLLGFCLFVFSVVVTADGNPGNSNAIAFAIQAGSIAGATQACGQDVTTFISRVNEAITRMAVTPSDRLFAMAAFQRASQQAQNTQMTAHTIPCSQVSQDFNNLPILKPDYQQTVIAQLPAGIPTPSPSLQTSTTPPNTVPTTQNAVTPDVAAANSTTQQVPPPPPVPTTMPQNTVSAPPNPATPTYGQAPMVTNVPPLNVPTTNNATPPIPPLQVPTTSNATPMTPPSTVAPPTAAMPIINAPVTSVPPNPNVTNSMP